jgi:four helix bundle protein
MSTGYRDLRVWQESMELVIAVYEQTRGFPRQETYGLTGQMRRAALSLPSNIAEGKGRSTDRDRSLFFAHTRGSLLELESPIMIAERLYYLSREKYEMSTQSSSRFGRMLNALFQSIQTPEEHAGWLQLSGRHQV